MFTDPERRKKYDNLEFLRPLVDRMTQISPKDRPSISEAMALFEPIYTARDRLRFRRRLHPFHEDRTTRYFQDVVAFNRDLGYMFCYSATYCYRLLTLQRPWKRWSISLFRFLLFLSGSSLSFFLFLLGKYILSSSRYQILWWRGVGSESFLLTTEMKSRLSGSLILIEHSHVMHQEYATPC